MAKDMNIAEFSDESEAEYINRILYSALASWIKASALDRSVGNEHEPNAGISKRHITEKSDRFLEEMIIRHPKCKHGLLLKIMILQHLLSEVVC